MKGQVPLAGASPQQSGNLMVVAMHDRRLEPMQQPVQFSQIQWVSAFTRSPDAPDCDTEINSSQQLGVELIIDQNEMYVSLRTLFVENIHEHGFSTARFKTEIDVNNSHTKVSLAFMRFRSLW
jgi:hypothetical protein